MNTRDCAHMPMAYSDQALIWFKMPPLAALDGCTHRATLGDKAAGWRVEFSLHKRREVLVALSVRCYGDPVIVAVSQYLCQLLELKDQSQIPSATQISDALGIEANRRHSVQNVIATLREAIDSPVSDAELMP